jgi:RNA polymerase sigma-70 factor (ECF subfamily)
MSAGAALQEAVITVESAPKAVSVTVEDLVHAYAQAVFRVAYSVVRDHAEAEDISQETFLRAMKHGRLGRIENHKAWLVTIAWRVAVERAKRRKAEPIEDILDTLHSTDKPPEEAIDAEKRAEILRRLIESLPNDLRQVIVLSTVEEMNSADIASAMGIPEGSVRTRMMRARQLMKQKLAMLLEKK